MILPAEGKVFAPCDGMISTIPSTKHAVGILGPADSEILIHVGMDTVKLNGKYFDCKVSEGDRVKKGDVLLEFDIKGIQSEGCPLVTPMVVCNSNDYDELEVVASGDIQTGTDLIRYKKS